MAEMNENVVYTRLQLKHDTYANWTNTSVERQGGKLVLRPGEIGICIIDNKDQGAQTAPTVLFKVGDGVHPFHDPDPSKCLKWASALAADVYAWAKEQSMFSSVVATETTTGEGDKQKTYVGNAVTNVEWDSTLNGGKGGIKFTKGTQFATKAELDAALEAFGGDLDAITDTDTKYSFEIPTTGDHKGKLAVTEKKYVNGSAEGNGTTTYYDFVTPDELETILEGYVVEVKGEGCIAVDNTDSQRPVVKHTAPEGAAAGSTANALVTKISTDEFGHVTEKDSANWTFHVTNDCDFDPSINDNNKGNVYFQIGDTKQKVNFYGSNGIKVGSFSSSSNEGHVYIDGSNLLQTAKDYADDNDANTEYHLEYDSTNKEIKLVEGKNASEMTIDATAFIKDGMIKSVELVNEDADKNKGQFLKIVWNTDADVDADDVTYVNVTTLVDVYVGDKTDNIEVTVTSDNKIKADLTTAAKGSLDRADTAHGWGDHAQAGYLKSGDIADLAKKVTSATAGNLAGLDANGNLTDSGSKAADFKTKQTVVVDPTANGTATEFIASIAQNENGEITATKKALPSNIVRREFVDTLPTVGEPGVHYYRKVYADEIPFEVRIGRVVKADSGYTFDSSDGSYTTLVFVKSGSTNAKIIGIDTNTTVEGVYGSTGILDHGGSLAYAEPLQIGSTRQIHYDHELSINTASSGNTAFDSSVIYVCVTGYTLGMDSWKIVHDIDNPYVISEYVDGKYVHLQTPGATANSSMFVDDAARIARRAETKADSNTEAIENLHTIATTGSIYDVAEGSAANIGADKVAHPKYLIFNCGSSTEII